MRLTFRIEYHTSWGESLHVLVDNGTEVELATSDGYLWQGHCEYRSGEEGQLVPYRYAVYKNVSRSLAKTFVESLTLVDAHNFAECPDVQRKVDGYRQQESRPMAADGKSDAEQARSYAA